MSRIFESPSCQRDVELKQKNWLDFQFKRSIFASKRNSERWYEGCIVIHNVKGNPCSFVIRLRIRSTDPIPYRRKYTIQYTHPRFHAGKSRAEICQGLKKEKSKRFPFRTPSICMNIQYRECWKTNLSTHLKKVI